MFYFGHWLDCRLSSFQSLNTQLKIKRGMFTVPEAENPITAMTMIDNSFILRLKTFNVLQITD